MWTQKEAIKEAKQYKSRSEFNKDSKGAYNWLLKNKKLYLLDKLFPKKEWTEKTALKEAKKYKTKKEFVKNSPGAYIWLTKLIVWLK